MLRRTLAVIFAGCAGCSATGEGTDPDPVSGPPELDPPEVEAPVDPPPKCPVAEGSFQDPLAHLGRAQGDTFIEILDVAVTAGQRPLVLACTGTQGLTIWDPADPSKAALLAENVGPKGLTHARFPRCQHASPTPDGASVIITNRGDEVQPKPFIALYDLADPKKPDLVASYSGPESIEGAVAVGDLIVAAAHRAGLLVLARKGKDLEVVGRFADENSDTWQVARHGDRLAVAEGAHGLRIFELDGRTPSPVGHVAIEGSSKDVVIAQDRGYVATSVGLSVIDVADPTKVSELGKVATQGTAVAVALGRPGVAFVADWDAVRAFDVSDPAKIAPLLSEVVPTKSAFSRVLALDATADGRVYAGEWEGMHVFEHRPDAHAPEVEAGPGVVQFGKVEHGGGGDRVVVVRNTGDRPLQVTGIEPSDPAVTVDRPCFDLEPGASTPIEVHFAPTCEHPIDATLALTTNDPDEAKLEVKVTANRGELDVGQPAPQFELRDLEGQSWNNDSLKGKVTLLAYFATF